MGIALEKLTESERETIARGLFKVTEPNVSNSGELHGLCPIHGEKNPSFDYNVKKDIFNCLSCGATGDLVQLYAKVKGMTNKEGFKAFCGQYGPFDTNTPRPSTPAPSKNFVPGAGAGDDLEAVWQKFKPLPESWLQRLQQLRGWSAAVINEHGLRKQTYYRAKDTGDLVKVRTPERIAIPIKNRSDQIRNFRLYKPGAKEMKIISWGKGYGKARLFPAQPKDAGLVLLCEGEQDTLCALSNGFNAITQTSKTKRWTKDHQAPFKDRDVVIAYDADQPGEEYAGHAAAAVYDTAKSVRILTWPDFMGRTDDGTWPDKHGQDLTDFFVKHKKTVPDLQDLITQATPYEPPDRPDVPESVRQFFASTPSGRYSFKPRLLANRILDDIEVMSEPETGLMYRWNNIFWEVYSEDHLESMAIKYLGDESQKSRAKDAAYQARILSTLPHGRQPNDQSEWITLANCAVNLDALDTQPHQSDHYATFALDVDFNPDAGHKCDRWLAFLDETIQTPAAIAQVQEFCGWCFTRDTRFAKCLLLYGPGADGKSVLIKTIRKLIGPDNCSAVSFAGLEDQFLRSSLYNKLLNISTEVGSRALESPYFKAVVSGDPIDAAFKHKNSFSFTPCCKLIFAANKLPRILDNSDGFFRRLLPISFKRQFFENDPDHDPDLEAKLETELSGIFEWAIVGLHRLWRQKKFTQCDETLRTLQAYRRLNNPVVAFIEDRCIVEDGQEVAKDDLYREFKTYCTASGYTALNKENFFREVYAAYNYLKQYRPRVDGQRVYHVQGIGIEVELDE